MHRGLKISVVIPCYNEEHGIRHTIGMLPASDRTKILDWIASGASD